MDAVSCLVTFIRLWSLAFCHLQFCTFSVVGIFAYKSFVSRIVLILADLLSSFEIYIELPVTYWFSRSNLLFNLIHNAFAISYAGAFVLFARGLVGALSLCSCTCQVWGLKLFLNSVFGRNKRLIRQIFLHIRWTKIPILHCEAPGR